MSPVRRKIARWSSRTAYFEFRYNNRDNTDSFGAAIALRNRLRPVCKASFLGFEQLDLTLPPQKPPKITAARQIAHSLAPAL